MSSGQDCLLVVDDEEMNRDMLSRRLERHGFRVEVAGNGKQALRLIENAPIDLLLLDHMMPGISGMELLELLRKEYSSSRLPIIMVTAQSESKTLVKALDLGANDYITKPIDFPVALARIRTQLQRKHAEEALSESEERYALAARGANDGLWDWNLKTDEIYYSPRLKEILGFEDHEIGNSPEEWFSRVHPDDIEHLRIDIRMHCEGGTDHLQSEHRIRHRNGTYRWILVRGIAIRNSDGRALRMAGSLTDITNAKVADALTGLPNRLLFLDRLERALQHSKKHNDFFFAVLFLDLDRFKLINDSLGHVMGDELLVEIAGRLRAGLRYSDTVARVEDEPTVARFGGDEFAILLDGIRHVSDATRVAERVLSHLATPFELEDHTVYAAASIGIAVSATGYENPQDLLRDADTAMYRAKALGGGRYEVFDSVMRDRAVGRLQLETDLRRAVANEEFKIVYQPILALSRRRTLGFEALLRWQRPDYGTVSPAEFIPVAEETGLIVPIGKWVLEKATEQMAAWQEQFPADPPLYISINVSGIQFGESELVQQIRQLLQHSSLNAGTLTVEITESVIMDNPEWVAFALSELKALGVKFSIDDFGTGYSSLSYLHRFPVDTLKIDRSFVSSVDRTGENLKIVPAIIELAHALSMDVVAEGIDTEEQAQLLTRLGCENGQGYLFSRPLEAKAAQEYLMAEQQKQTPVKIF